MRRIAMSLVVIVLVLGASRLLAQTSGPASQEEKRTSSSTTFVSDARIESTATVSSASPAFALVPDTVTLPVAASVVGLAPFYSDVRVFNTSYTVSAEVTAVYRFGAQPVRVFTLGPRASKAFDDICVSLFEVPNSLGVVEFSSSAGGLVVTSRLYSPVLTGGSVGMFIPGLPSSAAHAVTVLTGLSNGAFRTNIGVYNPNGVAVTATIQLFDGPVLLGTDPVVLPAFSGTQVNNIYTVLGVSGVVTTNGYATVTSSDTNSPLFTYAAEADNATQDTILIVGAADVPRPSCSYTVSPASPASFGSSGGSGTVSVTTQSGCAWTATSGSSFITITGGSSGSGNGSVSFSVASNGSASSRTGTMTIAGQTVTITQSGVSSGGIYDGTWRGTTSQTCDTSPCAISWTVANTAITGFSVGYDAHACGAIRGGTSITYDTPRPITGGSFTVTDTGGFRTNFSVGGTGPVDGHWTVNGTFNSSSSASGSGSVTLPVCSSTVPITFSATKM